MTMDREKLLEEFKELVYFFLTTESEDTQITPEEAILDGSLTEQDLNRAIEDVLYEVYDVSERQQLFIRPTTEDEPDDLEDEDNEYL